MRAGADGEGQRLDKWLWHGRFVKTRSLASQLVAGGKVRVNREKVFKPSHTLRAGDVITAAIAGRVRVVRVLAFSERRGPPAKAQALYADLIGENAVQRPSPGLGDSGEDGTA